MLRMSQAAAPRRQLSAFMEGAAMSQGLIPRKLTWHNSTRVPGYRYELLDRPDMKPRYVVVFMYNNVKINEHPCPHDEAQARDEFERLVEQHYDE
jgi:hypothetical protein